MLGIQEVFEAHLNVVNLDRAMKFYGSMLGLWETGSGPQRMQLHTAFAMKLADLPGAIGKLKARDIVSLDFERRPTEEPVVLTWMPAAAVYFDDPDGNQLEFIAMLPDEPQPELGILRWSEWKKRSLL